MVLFGLLLLIMWLVRYRFTLKAVLIFLLIVASITGYFTDTYGTVYDTNMLQNALQTDKAETSDLFNIMFIAYRIIESDSDFLVADKKCISLSLKALWCSAGNFVLSLVLVALPILAQSKQFATFFREHKPLRLYTNPVTPIYAVGKLASVQYNKLKAPKIRFIMPMMPSKPHHRLLVNQNW